MSTQLFLRKTTPRYPRSGNFSIVLTSSPQNYLTGLLSLNSLFANNLFLIMIHLLDPCRFILLTLCNKISVQCKSTFGQLFLQYICPNPSLNLFILPVSILFILLSSCSPILNGLTMVLGLIQESNQLSTAPNIFTRSGIPRYR